MVRAVAQSRFVAPSMMSSTKYKLVQESETVTRKSEGSQERTLVEDEQQLHGQKGSE